MKLQKPAKKIKNSKKTAVRKPVAGPLQIFKYSINQLLDHKKFFGGIATIYGLLILIFVRGLSGFNIEPTKQALSETLGVSGNLSSSLAAFGILLTDAAGASDIASLYQTIIFIICSLAIIWGIRNTKLKNPKNLKNLRFKDAFYKGMYPLVPLLLVLLIISLQFLPLSVGGVIYSATIGQGLAIMLWEKILWVVLVLALALWSFYMLCSSILAVYIVTLPDVTPLQALRSAKALVKRRRLIVAGRLLWLLIILMIILGLVVIPLIAFVPILAELAFFVCAVLVLPIFHTYAYNLYRELL